MAPLTTSDTIRQQMLMMYGRQDVEEARLRSLRIRTERFDSGRIFLEKYWDEGLATNYSMTPAQEPDRKAIPRLGVALADEDEGETMLAKEAAELLGYNVLRRKLHIPGKLGEILAMLDIEPLSTEAVEKYKADMVLWRHKHFSESARAQYQVYALQVNWLRTALADCKNEVPLFALRKAIQVKKACPEAILEVDELIEEEKLIDPFLVARLDDETYYLEVWKEPKFEETL